MCEKRFGVDAAFGECFFHDGQGHEFGCPRCDSSLYQYEAVRLNFFADSFHGRLERFHLGVSCSEITEVIFRIVTLDIDDYAVC